MSDDGLSDDSTANRRNPSAPPRNVTSGQEPTGEMCIAFDRGTVDAEPLGYRPRRTV